MTISTGFRQPSPRRYSGRLQEPVYGDDWQVRRVRHNGEEDVSLDPAEVPGPLGEVLPSFTIHTLAGGLTLFENDNQRHSLGLIVDNASDELYAEFSNATFFRPQPKRSVILTYDLRFK